MWTPKYEIFHRLIQESMDRFPRLRADFCDRPIFFEQALFNKKLSTEASVHSFMNSNLKVDLIIQCIEQNWGKYFIFSDADIFIRSAKVKEMCAPFMELSYDSVFMAENSYDSEVNIGFILTRANKATLALWKDIQARINQNGGHDQSIMNNILREGWSGKWCTFDIDDVVSNKTYRDDKFIIFQFLSSCNGYESDMAEKLFSQYKFTNYDISHLYYLLDDKILNFKG
uniref:Nucleotide-diphospho-sugar transferase domain-containing protein n=1 Tax=viral metagenome TaxID=1070528 RepID=A0A6C0K684_9ZZZZ